MSVIMVILRLFRPKSFDSPGLGAIKRFVEEAFPLIEKIESLSSIITEVGVPIH